MSRRSPELLAPNSSLVYNIKITLLNLKTNQSNARLIVSIQQLSNFHWPCIQLKESLIPNNTLPSIDIIVSPEKEKIEERQPMPPLLPPKKRNEDHNYFFQIYVTFWRFLEFIPRFFI